jgi:hypothetical protein
MAAGDGSAAVEPQSAIARVEPDAEPEVVDAEPVSEFELDLDEFNTLKIKLGGRGFLAKEPSIATQKAIINASRDDDSPAEGEEGDAKQDEDAVQAIKSLRNLSGIYPQIEQVLFHLDGDEKGKPPSREFVEENLRISSFGRLFKKLVDSEDAEGKGSSA